MGIRSQGICFLLCSVVTLAVLPLGAAYCQGISTGGPAKGLRLTGSVTAGFDSFQERYSIVDKDTLDVINEFRASAALGLLAGTFLRDFVLLEGRARYSDDSIEASGLLKFTKLFLSGTTRLGFEGDLKRRVFDENSTYQFPNDYQRLYVRGYVRHSFARSFAIRLTDRLEHLDYQERTEFDYDYRRNKLSLNGEFEWNYTTFLDLRASHVAMVVPDSTEIEYQSLIPSFEIRHFSGLHSRFVFLTAVERRQYVIGSPRSSFWATLGSFAGEWAVNDVTSVLLEDDFEWYEYDAKDPIYFDYKENRTALIFKLNPTLQLSFGAGPAYGFLDSDVSDQDEYTEFGAKFVFEYNRGGTAWVSFAYEPGRREYKTYGQATQTDEISLFSNYSYNRMSLYTNFRVLDGLSFSGFLDYQPEDHERESDDATATLLSLSLIYMF